MTADPALSRIEGSHRFLYERIQSQLDTFMGRIVL